jgi:methylated-DNA-[protein]-cysteine S-methyltransferase
MQTDTYRYDSPLGPLLLTLADGALFALEYETSGANESYPELPGGAVRGWLDGYFKGAETSVVPPLAMRGTTFQQRVWRAMLDIPVGSTRTYGEIAKLIGSAPRAVGQACKRNFLPIIIPCHRVVGGQSIGGYEGALAGQRVERKSWLLQHEKNHTATA